MATVKTIKKQKELLLGHLRTVPIINLACAKIGISRATFYRWCEESEDFKTDIENAKIDGIENINDLSESQLVALLKEKKFQAVAFWLRNRPSKELK
jgi:ACT domain-containing protein